MGNAITARLIPRAGRPAIAEDPAEVIAAGAAKGATKGELDVDDVRMLLRELRLRRELRAQD